MVQLRQMLKRLAPHQRVYRVALLLAVSLILFFMLSARLVPDGIDLAVGEASLTFIGAPRRVQDRHTTSALKEAARQAVGEVYDQDNAVVEQVISNVEDFFDIFAITSAKDLTAEEKVTAVKQAAPFSITENSIKVGLGLDIAARQELLAALRTKLTPLYLLGIKEDGVDLARIRLRDALRESTMSLERRVLLSEVASPLMTHNLRFNEAATVQARDVAAERASPIYLQVGQRIIGQGEIATAREIALLEDLGLLRRGFDLGAFSGVWLWTILLLAFPLAYLHFNHRGVYASTLQMALIAVICVGVSLAAFSLAGLSGFFMPIATAGMLITVLIDAKVGMGMAVALSLVAAGFTNFEPRFFFVALLGSMASIYAVSNSELRRSLVRGGAVVGVVNVVTIAAFALLAGNGAQQTLWDMFIGFGNGLLSSVLTIGSLPFLESTFGVVSSIKLAELANPQQPLLKRLLIEAPGTYHHSLIVANLAESAAEQVGADTLKTRVGAYYHDVGKVERPYFFIENQLLAENPHDDYSPHLSALIIISHVKDGVRLAREHKLPEVIIDIIKQHHGTSLAQYFYNKAHKTDRDTKEEDFRYEGPRPTSKEAAIVMLADIVEAAVRAMTAPSAAKIEQRVRSLLSDRLHDGQLDASDLTLREIDTIGTAFIHHLSGIFHRRIEYPKQKEASRTMHVIWSNEQDRVALPSNVEALFHTVALRAAEVLKLPAHAELSIALVDDEAISRLNKQYRGKTGATDVLSFALVAKGDIGREPTDKPLMLGDIIISMERVATQAEDLGHSMERELSFLLVHGLAHLAGMDHDANNDGEMRVVSEDILASLGILR